MKFRPWMHTLLVSALCAAAVWALSPAISGHKEPWDAVSHYYTLGLIFAGLVAGLLSPRVIWAYIAGAVAGQLLYVIIFLETGPLVAVGFVFMWIYGLAFLAAALLAAYVRKRVGARD
jgi:hypothetical protein